jgi:hypothetical protein
MRVDEWERWIPMVPIMILPSLSIDLPLCAVRSRRERARERAKELAQRSREAEGDWGGVPGLVVRLDGIHGL